MSNVALNFKNNENEPYHENFLFKNEEDYLKI